MYIQHEHVETPHDRTTVWRYMSLAAFIGVLLDKALFFSRIDHAEDPWDGVFPKRSCDPDEVAHFFSKGENIDPFYRVFAKGAVEHNAERNSFCISCWHINKSESDAMWKIYSLLGQGIAIRSSVGRLKRAFVNAPQKVFIGKMNYYDYDKILINPVMVFPVVFSKREAFRHEKELRCVLYSWGREFETEYGEHVSVELQTLIGEVILSPRAEPWILALLQKLISKCGFTFQCRASTHLATPNIPWIPDNEGQFDEDGSEIDDKPLL